MQSLHQATFNTALLPLPQSKPIEAFNFNELVNCFNQKKPVVLDTCRQFLGCSTSEKMPLSTLPLEQYEKQENILLDVALHFEVTGKRELALTIWEAINQFRHPSSRVSNEATMQESRFKTTFLLSSDLMVLLFAAAEAGRPVAQYVVSEIYYTGTGITADWVKAADYLDKSAAQQYEPAHQQIETRKAALQGVKNMSTKALLDAVKQKQDVLAMFVLGGRYASEGKFHDAATYFRMAAERKCQDAFFPLVTNLFAQFGVLKVGRTGSSNSITQVFNDSVNLFQESSDAEAESTQAALNLKKQCVEILVDAEKFCKKALKIANQSGKNVEEIIKLSADIRLTLNQELSQLKFSTLESIVKVNNSAHLNYVLGNLYETKKMYGSAAYCFKMAVYKNKEERGVAYKVVANLASQAESFRAKSQYAASARILIDALDYCEKIVGMDDDLIQHVNQQLLCDLQGVNEGVLEKIINTTGNVHAMYIMGERCEAGGRRNEAVSYFKMAADKHGHQVAAYRAAFNLEMLAKKTKNSKEVEVLLNDALMYYKAGSTVDALKDKAQLSCERVEKKLSAIKESQETFAALQVDLARENGDLPAVPAAATPMVDVGAYCIGTVESISN